MRTPSGNTVYGMGAEYPSASALYEAAKRVRDAGFKRWDWRTVPAFFPIMFELTILFSAFSAFFAVLTMNGLPRWNHPVFNWRRFSRATNDGFFLIIEARDPRFTELEARELLEQSGGTHVTIIHEEGEI